MIAKTYEAVESNSQPSQEPVGDEKRELDEKIQKLIAFVYSETVISFVKDEDERQRLLQKFDNPN